MEAENDALRILILNWRDQRHPRAGGAEVLTHEHARRLVQRGHDVTMFVGAAKGAAPAETVDGVRVIRRGGPVTTRLHAVRWYAGQRRSHAGFDVVVEEINTLPYLAGRFSSAPVVLWFHQLAREVWWYEAPKPLAFIGFTLERSYLKLSRRVPAIVLSPSTREDLLALGFPEDSVVVVPPGIDFPALAAVEKEHGLLVYLGRITPSKRVDHLIEALAAVRARGVEARLEIAGAGTDQARDGLERRARELGVARHVRVLGYLDTSAKQDLLARASLILMASVREGWGLVVTEANAVGTPAVVYDRPGLRDSTLHDRTGLVTAPDPASLAAGVVRALTEPGLYETLQAGAIAWSKRFSWESASAAFERAVRDVARGTRGARGTPALERSASAA